LQRRRSTSTGHGLPHLRLRWFLLAAVIATVAANGDVTRATWTAWAGQNWPLSRSNQLISGHHHAHHFALWLTFSFSCSHMAPKGQYKNLWLSLGHHCGHPWVVLTLKISSNQIWVAGYFGQPLTYPDFTIFSSDFFCNSLKS
jgi:hypothetical protein